MVVSILFFLLFRNQSKPLLPYSYLSKTPIGLPGMDRKPIRKSKPTRVSTRVSTDNERGKPLPPPKMPVAPVPLVVNVAPSGPPLKKPMMT